MIAPPIFPFVPTKPIDKNIREEDGDDHFESLPDPIVSAILTMVLDAKSLCRCLAVSKRFASLVPEVDAVSVVASPTLIPKKPSFSLKSLFLKLLRHPPKKPAIIGPAELSHCINNSIKNFPRIRRLRVQLPGNGGVAGFPDTEGGLLKWSAEFGKELQRCTILGATSFTRPPTTNWNQTQNWPSDEELRLRVVWILSSLISACARHGLVRKTVLDCPNLCSAVIVDDHKQGRLLMNENQIKELRESATIEDDGPLWKRTNVPNLIVELWYAPELVLARSGYVMKGATVVAVRPETGRLEDEGAVGTEYELLKGGFVNDEAGDDVFGEAVREIIKRKGKLMYRLQMKSFQ